MLIVQTSSKESVVWQENEGGSLTNNQYIHINWRCLIFSVSYAILSPLQEHKFCLKMPAVEKCYFGM